MGAYGGLIIILLSGYGGSPNEPLFLITQDNLDILTNTLDQILVQE